VEKSNGTTIKAKREKKRKKERIKGGVRKSQKERGIDRMFEYVCVF
jgi:hypothetical protein